MLNFKPALMRHTALIQSKTRTQDSDGNGSYTWTDEHTNVPCSILALSGKEYVTSSQLGSEIVVRFNMYNLTPLDASMRIVANSMNYDIVDILPDPTNNVYINIMARQGVSNG